MIEYPVKLAITGVPKPRMTQSDKWRSRPCTARYWAFKDELLSIWGDRELPDTFHAIFTMPMPDGWSEKRKAIFNGKPHQAKPDGDNLLKAFQDSLLSDDAAIWDVRVTKLWGMEGSIEIRLLI
jgi:Holliday junction resolvase RusA-like endonuclease